jgi:hypothetical protein
MGKIEQLGRDTAISLGIVVSVITVVWVLASDRQKALAQIDHNSQAIVTLQEEIGQISASVQYLREGMIRLEAKNGTLPKGIDP